MPEWVTTFLKWRLSLRWMLRRASLRQPNNSTASRVARSSSRATRVASSLSLLVITAIHAKMAEPTSQSICSTPTITIPSFASAIFPPPPTLPPSMKTLKMVLLWPPCRSSTLTKEPTERPTSKSRPATNLDTFDLKVMCFPLHSVGGCWMVVFLY